MKDESGGEAETARYVFGPFQLEPAARLVTSGPERTPVAIKGKAFDALVLLVTHAGTLVTRSVLIEALWPRSVVEENSLNKLIASLRRGLGESDDHRYIVTVQGRGYQFVAPVLRAGTESTVTVTSVRAPATRSARQLIVLLAGTGLVAGLLAVNYRTPAPAALSPWPGPVSRVASVTTFNGDELSPSLSPDGSRVAFSWNATPENRDIYVMTVGAAAPLRVTQDPAVDRDPSWSPDGSRIAFLRQRDHTTVDAITVPAGGGNEQRIRTLKMQFVSREAAPRLAWTADSRQLIVTSQFEADAAEGSHHLHRISLQGDESTAITTGRGVYDSSPALSPDGSQLAFSRFRIGERLSQLMIQPLDALSPKGEPRIVSGVPAGTPHSPAWSKDGSQLVFVIGSDIYSWSEKNGTRKVHAAAGVLGGTQHSSVVSSLSMDLHSSLLRAVAAKIDASSEIWALPLDSRTHAATGPPQPRVSSSAWESHPRFSPEGSRLAFVSSRSGQTAVWVAEADGDEPRQLTSLPSFVTGFPHWSPNGREIAFHASFPDQERQIYVVDLSGGMPRRIGSGCCPEWTADGKHLWVTEVGDGNSLARLRVEDGRREGFFEGEMPHETPDGERLIFARFSQSGLFQRSARGNPSDNPEVRLVDDYVPPIGGIAPAADGFFYIGTSAAGTPRALRFYDYRQKRARDIAPVPNSTGLGMALAPDGNEILYSAGAASSGADLVLLEFEPGK